MINCMRSSKRKMALALILFWCLAGVSTANQASSASPSKSESPAVTKDSAKSISTVSPQDFITGKKELAVETELKILKEKKHPYF